MHPIDVSSGGHRTAQEAVLAELRRSMAAGELRPGQPIRQDVIALRLGVSRVPVREALKVLQGEGLVDYRPHRGYAAAQLDLDGLRESYRLRQLLETEACRLVVPTLTPDQIDELASWARLVDEYGEADDLAAMNDANRRFHYLLLESEAHPRLSSFIRVLWDGTDPYRTYYYSTPANRLRVRVEHHDMVEAARQGDVERLLRLQDEHRRHAVDAIARALAAEREATG